MPPAVTEVARSVDALYGFLLTASFISCVLVIGGLIYFAIKYRRNKEGEKTAYISHNTTLEFLWSFIPFVIFMVVFVWGWIVYHKLRAMPEGALEVAVTAQKWDWSFTYKNGRRSPGILTVPVNQDVKLVMGSKDVLHSFYIPAMRTKQDVVPGRYTALWFKAEQEGSYHVFCAEYCGDKHSAMLAKVNVVSREAYDEWLSTEPYKGLTPVQIGQKIYGTTCIACHGLAKDEKKTGPTFFGLFGRSEEMEGGVTITVDENYIRESIMNPIAKVVKGYPKGVMPTYAGQLNDDELMGLIEYLKTVK
jgi:cytochrome c oxidase subunit 2